MSRDKEGLSIYIYRMLNNCSGCMKERIECKGVSAICYIWDQMCTVYSGLRGGGGERGKGEL